MDAPDAGAADRPAVRVDRVESATLITLDRPNVRNAISRGMALRLQSTVEHASSDASTRCVIIAAEGEVFAAGGDLRELERLRQAPSGVDEVLAMGSALRAIERCDVPVIAALQGSVFGGACELVLACDLVAMESQATLSFRQAAMGLSPAWGGATRLIERVGPVRASQILLLGDSITAAQAAAWSLVNAEVTKSAALECAMDWSRRIARLPRAAVAGCKRALLQVREAHRDDSLQREQAVFASLWNGPDHQAAMASFLTRGT
jgi:enoyl-CoA hydratase/carnithine racemase